MDDVPAAPITKRRLIPLRIAVYALLLCGGLAWAYQLPTDPHRDLDTVLDAAESAKGEGRRFHEGGAFLYFMPKEGYVLTLAVHTNRERFPRANFVTVVGGKDGTPLQCSKTIPSPAGGFSTEEVIEGDELRAFLEAVEIELDPLQNTYQRYYR